MYFVRLSFLIFVFFLNSSGYAYKSTSYSLKHAKDRGDDCEEAYAKILRSRYPQFKIVRNATYQLAHSGQDLGELDFLVVQRRDVLGVIEVKCWRQFDLAFQKAQDQITRFYDHLADEISIRSDSSISLRFGRETEYWIAIYNFVQKKFEEQRVL